jgi:hypothetical protein
MDWSKYPLEKLSYVVAGIAPGLIALLVYPHSFAWFFSLGFLGYRTKLAVIVLVAFVIGNSITRFLTSILGAIGGAIGAVRYRPPHEFKVGPWRDPTWRAALSKVLPIAPNDTLPMAQWLYEARLREIEFLPEAQRGPAVTELKLAKLKSEREDGEWARWYDHYHRLVLQPSDHDVLFHVQRGLHFNLQAAGVYVLLAALIVPRVRHWWCLLPACLWVAILFAEERYGFQQWSIRWSTLDKQIVLLTDLTRGAVARP